MKPHVTFIHGVRNKNKSSTLHNAFFQLVLLICFCLLASPLKAETDAEDSSPNFKGIYPLILKTYRDLGPDSSICQGFNDFKYKIPANNKTPIQEPEGDLKRCYQQLVRFEKSDIEYNLHFLEFDDKGQFYSVGAKQLESIKEQVKSAPQYFIVFIHGWRHSAKPGDTDIEKFKMMMAYAYRFLEQRHPDKNNRPKLTGLYVGWPGAIKGDCGKRCSLKISLSLKSRKTVSEVISQSVTEKLKEIEAAMRQSPHGNKSKMLVMGHSLGGNMLINGLLKTGLLDSLKNHKPGDIFKPPLGDLTILLNPASEVDNWIKIQEEIRLKMGLKESTNLATPPKLKGKERLKATHKNHNHFNARQKPVLIAFTARCDKFLCKSHDTSVRYLFYWYKGGIFNPFRKRRFAIGHYRQLRKKDKMFGVTHELDINKGSKALPTNARNVLTQKKASICNNADGWLHKTKKEALVHFKGNVYPTGWNTIYEGEEPLLFVNRETGLNAQFVHSRPKAKVVPIFSRKEKKTREVLTTAHDPFWNIQADGSAAFGHGGFYSYPSWCAFNQIVLDDITKQ